MLRRFLQMIFNLVKKAKEIFINKANTGVEAENVEDAIKVLNSNLTNALGGYTKISTCETKFASGSGYNFVPSTELIGYNTVDFIVIGAEYKNNNGSWYSIPIGCTDSNGMGIIKISNIVRIYLTSSEFFDLPVKLYILHK